MADTITQSNVIQITMMDAGGNRKSFNIDNPRSDINMTAIKTALSSAIGSGIWYNDSTAQPFTAVNSATLTETKKIKMDDSDVTIEITPSTVTVPSSGSMNVTVTVSPIEPTGAYITNLSTTAGNYMYADIDHEYVYVKGDFTHPDSDATATLNILVAGRVIQVPIKSS